MVLENSYFDGVQHPYQADATAELVERGSVLRNTSGRTDERGAAFDPRTFYPYRLDPAVAVPTPSSSTTRLPSTGVRRGAPPSGSPRTTSRPATSPSATTSTRPRSS